MSDVSTPYVYIMLHAVTDIEIPIVILYENNHISKNYNCMLQVVYFDLKSWQNRMSAQMRGVFGNVMGNSKRNV